MKRRRFFFWMGFGLFSLNERLHVNCLDGLAAAAMNATEAKPEPPAAASPTHWQAAENDTWRWYERETLVDGKWKLTGITTPVNRLTGEPFVGRSGYLDESLVPDAMRFGADDPDETEASIADHDFSHHAAKPERRARHGRPPSKWLRSLKADEIRLWLKTIDVPEAGVEGMTYWTHLTRDHYFDAAKISGLSIDEQAKLHAAAHDGY